MTDIQIHELPSNTGSLGSSDYLATDNGTNTTKIAVTDIPTVLIVTVPSFDSLPQQVTNTNITADMIVMKAELGTPSAQTGNWTVTTSAGSLEVDGTNAIDGSTTLTLYLERSR